MHHTHIHRRLFLVPVALTDPIHHTDIHLLVRLRVSFCLSYHFHRRFTLCLDLRLFKYSVLPCLACKGSMTIFAIFRLMRLILSISHIVHRLNLAFFYALLNRLLLYNQS